MKRKTFIKKLRAFTTEVHCLNKARGVGGYNPKYCIFTGRDFVLPTGYSYQELYDDVMRNPIVGMFEVFMLEVSMK